MKEAQLGVVPKMKKVKVENKETIMKIDGCEYPLIHGARLTLATPKIVSETLKKLAKN